MHFAKSALLKRKVKAMKSTGKGRRTIRIAVLAMTLMMTFAAVPLMGDVAFADDEKTTTGLSLGVSDLNNPAEGAGGWCKVYYGSAKAPLRFNVLNKNETVFSNASTPTLLLDCDSIVKTGIASTALIYAWSGSDMATALSSIGNEYFTEADTFGIYKSRKIYPASDDCYPYPDEDNKEYEFEGFGGSGVYVCNLDASEIMNPKYGFPANMTATDLRKKTGGSYWVRSGDGGSHASEVGYVKNDGSLGKQIDTATSGYSPTINIDRSRILFTSLISGTAGQAGAEYKLTIIDKTNWSEDLKTYFKTEVTGAITRDGDVITIPFKVSGNRAANATQVSVLITDKAWNTEGAQILKYGKLDITGGSVTSSGTGTFKLPESCYRASGNDYYAYVFAEDVNDGNFTDFASPPVTMNIPAAEMTVTAEDYKGKYDGAAHGIGLEITPKGISKIATIKYGNSEGTYDLDTAPKRTKAGEQTVYYQVSAEGFGTKTGSARIVVEQKPLTVTYVKVVDKVYDGNTNTTFSSITLSGQVNHTDVSATATGTFENKNVGTDKTVSISGYELTGEDKDNYVLAEGGHVTTTKASITPRSVSVSGITADDKIYDGNTNATLNTGDANIVGLIGNDSVSIAEGATGTFADKNVGSDKTVSYSGLTLTGTDAPNYALDASQATTTASITPKSVKISGITAEDKTYDRTTNATVKTDATVLDGKVDGDDLSIDTTSLTGAFEDKNADTGKTVTLSGLALTGNDADNYTLSSDSQAETTATINKKSATVRDVTANDKVYDGTTDATLDTGGMNIGGIVTGDNVGASAVGAFESAGVGNDKRVNITFTLNGADAGNYELNLTPGGGTQNYTTADITARSVNVSGITAEDKTYDGTTDATVKTDDAVLDGKAEGDDLSVTAIGAFADKYVGMGKTVNISDITLTGGDVGNYTLDADNSQKTTEADINHKPLIISGIKADDRDYDGTDVATLDLTSATITGAISGEAVAVSSASTGKFDNENAGTNKTVTLNGLALDGTDAGNYTLDSENSQKEATASIFRRPVKITGVEAKDKDYDGTTKVTLNDGRFTLENKVDGDVLNATATATFDDKNAGTGKNVTISSYVLTGAKQGNYMVSADSQKETSADIRKKLVSVSIPTTEKVYDGTTDVPADFDITAAAINGTVDGDIVSVASGNAVYEDANVGDSKTVNLSNLTLGGKDADNYNLPSETTSTGKITRKGLIVSGITAKNKNYDGKKDATLITSGMKVEGVVPNDDVTVKPSGAFADANAGKGKKVYITYSLSGEKAGNYAIDTAASQAETTADIIAPEPKPEPTPTPTPKPTPTPEPTPTPVTKVKTALVAKGIASGKKSIKFTWTKVNNASGYDIFLSRCSYKGKTYKPRKVKTIKGNKTVTWTKKGLAKNTSYKAYVRAYKIKDGKKTYIKRSPMIHMCTGNSRKSLTNPKSISINKTKVTLKKGKTATVKAKVTKVNAGLKLPDDHAVRVRYLSADKKIATVSKSGKIKAKKKGVCYVYVYAQNGLWKTCKVTVK